jgi:phosphatidyl-myo-inositol dimannoside synthase
VPSLLVTNDFPPKVGGIQSYLHELWRRLPPEDTTVLTTPYAGAGDFDTEQPFRVERVGERVMLPTGSLAGRIDALAREVGAGVILLDPALPLGRLGRRLDAAPYVVIAHGAEITVPGRLPGTRRLLGQVLRGADAVIAAGAYPARECTHAAGRALQGIVVPPGVDVDRF